MTYHVSYDIDFLRNPYPGKLIVIEGIDGSGKSTQVKRLARLLEKNGHTVFLGKNPTSNPIGKFIRKILSGKIILPSVSFQYLFTADRHVQQLEIIDHLQKGHIVLVDRYFWSAIAYGIIERESDENDIQVLLATQAILSTFHQQLIPDINFFLKISPKVAIKRLNNTKKQKEI